MDDRDTFTFLGCGKRACAAPLAALPRTLCHTDNVEFLTGASRVLGIRSIAPFVEQALRTYAAEADLLTVANALESHWHAATTACDGPDLWISMAYSRRLATAKVKFNVLPRVSEESDRKDLARRHTYSVPSLFIFAEECETRISSIFRTSLPFVLSTAPSVVGRHVVYAHNFGGIPYVGGFKAGLRNYVGITKQGWAARWAQHVSVANRGSPYLFHEAIRRSDENSRSHEVVACGLGFEEAMQVEEAMVQRLSLYPRGLNMIPGGFAGLKYLAKNGFHPDQKNLACAWDRRHVILQQFARRCERAGRANPLAAARWQDDAYAAQIICANPNNFTLEQVREIRYMDGLGNGASVIAASLGCDERRVLKLLAGETYSRVS